LHQNSCVVLNNREAKEQALTQQATIVTWRLVVSDTIGRCFVLWFKLTCLVVSSVIIGEKRKFKNAKQTLTLPSGQLSLLFEFGTLE